jgi:tetratricopeptide (TPR) repeat protein
VGVRARFVLLASSGLLYGTVATAHVGMDELDARSAAALAARPDDATAHLERARVLQLEHQWDAALVALEAAAVRGADADVVGGVRASVYLDAGFPRMATLEVDRVLARRPDAAGLLVVRARASLALGNREAAAADFGEAIAKGPQPTPELVIARRDVLVALGKRAEAVQALDAGMDRIGHVVSLEMPAIDLEVELGRYDAALARLDRLTRDASVPNPLWIARRGDVLERAGRATEARAEYAKALALIDARAATRAQPFDDLKRRLETALATSDHRGERQ